jgi:hypothetical protein
MYQPYFEEVTRFAAEGELGPELQKAKAEFTQRTGEMFETDPSFERRIAAFLEWYVLDRKVSFRPDLTPVELFILQKTGGLSETERNRYAGLTHTTLSLFEYKKGKPDTLVLRDLLSAEKIEVFERRKPAGLEPNDILEARIVPYEGLLLFADAYYCHPRDARKEILEAARRFRKRKDSESALERIAFVHRVAFFANRSERYRHLDPRKVFAELNGKAA